MLIVRPVDVEHLEPNSPDTVKAPNVNDLSTSTNRSSEEFQLPTDSERGDLADVKIEIDGQADEYATTENPESPATGGVYT